MIGELWVNPEFRGHGISTALMTAAEGIARESGSSTASFWVMDENAAAIDFYTSLGYLPTGTQRPADPEQPNRGSASEYAKSLDN